MKFADSLFASALAIAQAPINLANSLLDRITNSEALKILKSMVEDKVRQVLAEAVFDPCEAAKVAPDILQALEALERLSNGTLQWNTRTFQRGFKDYLLRRSPPHVEVAEVIAMLEGFANYMWLAQRACERAVAKLLKKDDPLRRTVPADSAGSGSSAGSAGSAGSADLDLPVMGHQHQRYLIPIVVPTPWTEKDQFDYLRSGLVRVAAYTKRFAVDQQAAIEATRHEGGKVYGPYEVWTAAAQLMGLAIVANVTCVTLARLPTASSASTVPANGAAAQRAAVESDPPPDPPALPKAGS